ncbi:MAG: hypothetical protein D6756_04505 [Cyanobacteria bacterium J083]|nr:MAG: hypothetical protein D6756_04505 [Cyanobacteria bacterium J083]
MDYLYFLANASLTLRVIEYLNKHSSLSVSSMTVIHQIDGWILRLKFPRALTPQQHGDLVAYMQELGIAYEPVARLQMVFWGLDNGQSPVEMMQKYKIAIISHGRPNAKEIEAFREQFTKGLGYCPETLA